MVNEQVVQCLKEIQENMNCDLFQLDEETEQELLDCDARNYTTEETLEALGLAIKWVEREVGEAKEVKKLLLDLSRYKKGYASVMAYYNTLHHDDRIELDKRLKKFDL